ncbi:MAG: amino acid ABC transporter permease [Deltaproteobacteria bacterium]|nr:amino acid ABC transporter permease [Deltaproteobacteria bacterium]
MPILENRFAWLRNRNLHWELAKLALLSAVLVWLGARSIEAIDYHWQWYRIPDYLFFSADEHWRPGLLLQGLEVTFRIVGCSLVLAAVFGLATALMRLSGSFVARTLARAYLEAVRNTPLLIQLFFLYFVVSPILDIGRFSTAVLTLSLFEGAYASEIFRAGILSIDKGQWEAAYSSGLKTVALYRHIILPQALNRILPPLTSQAVSLIKDSALVSTIAIYDLTMQGQSIVSETFLTFEIWFTVALIYLCIAIAVSGFARFLEMRMKIPA